MTTSAKVIADSISEAGIRITTMQLRYPLIIHGEAKTHRRFSISDDDQYELVLKQEVGFMDDKMLSRNAASNRAIPTKNILEQVENCAFYPQSWGRNQPGMQADEELNEADSREADGEWEMGINGAIKHAQKLSVIGVHKQLANRLLMPFQYIEVIVTATEWDNFFKLRIHNAAQPEMQTLAIRMQEAMNYSCPKDLKPGEWHLPYVDFPGSRGKELVLEKAIKCSVARCARVSYLNHDNSTPDVEKDIALADMLLAAGHMSPFEHIATPMNFAKDTFELAWENGVTHKDRDNNFWSGNFRGWIQHRALI